MHPHNRKKLDDRVVSAAEAALAAQKYVSPVDVLVGNRMARSRRTHALAAGTGRVPRGDRADCRAFPRP